MTRHRLGIVTNEFFDRTEGGIGGFGWATRAVCALLRQRPELGLEPVVLTPRRGAVENVAGAHVVHQSGNRLQLARAVRQARIDLLLAIDYRPNYLPLLAALPRTPLVVWARDPRSPDDDQRVAAVRIPGREEEVPYGVDPIDCTSLRRVVAASRVVGRPVLFGSPAPTLHAGRAPQAYGLDHIELELLPNPIDTRPSGDKSARPLLVFLARLDPYKRPWLLVEAARHLPEVQFRVAGEPGGGPAAIGDLGTLPANVELVGHVDGEEKQRLLTSAWALVNTSVHEGLPVSFLEALACETPIVAALDPEGVVSRFGTVVDQSEGSGEPLVPSLVGALRRLLADGERRQAIGRAGRDWVGEVHTPAAFLTRAHEACEAGRRQHRRRHRDVGREMRILLLNDYAAPAGGAEIQTLLLRTWLTERGHDARIFASSVGGDVERG